MRNEGIWILYAPSWSRRNEGRFSLFISELFLQYINQHDPRLYLAFTQVFQFFAFQLLQLTFSELISDQDYNFLLKILIFTLQNIGLFLFFLTLILILFIFLIFYFIRCWKYFSLNLPNLFNINN